MARYAYFFSLIGAAALILAGCDQLDDPVIPVTTNYLEAVYGPAPTKLSRAKLRIIAL